MIYKSCVTCAGLSFTCLDVFNYNIIYALVIPTKTCHSLLPSSSSLCSCYVLHNNQERLRWKKDFTNRKPTDSVTLPTFLSPFAASIRVNLVVCGNFKIRFVNFTACNACAPADLCVQNFAAGKLKCINSANKM